MILVDTSVWVDHLRVGDDGLIRLLQDRGVLGHPFVLGELSMGTLRHRDLLLYDLARLPQAEVASDPEVRHFIEEGRLYGRGIGYVDAHLLASIRLTPAAVLWTRDQRLHTVADEMKLAATWSK